MSISERDFKELKKKAVEAQQARDRAQGQLESAMERLKTEFGCDSIEAAEKKASRLEKEAAAAERDYDDAVAIFEKEWEARSATEDS